MIIFFLVPLISAALFEKTDDPWDLRSLLSTWDAITTDFVGKWTANAPMFQDSDPLGMSKGYSIQSHSEEFYGVRFALYNGDYINDATTVQFGGYKAE
jgi:hypothetical protein